MGEATVRPRGLRMPEAAPFILVLAVPIPAGAFELSGGVRLGGFQVGGLAAMIVPGPALRWRVK